MSAAQLARATEPFYTTKRLDKGSGLGLSSVYSFAKNSGGELRITSQQGVGTTVDLVLPVAARGAERTPQALSAPELPPHVGTLLLVEDDDRVRKMAHQHLTALGYTVVEVETAESALEVIEVGLMPDVLFTDISLPGRLDGYALACHVVEDHATVKVLLTTGADTPKLDVAGVDSGRFPLLRKLYTPATLAEALHRLFEPQTT
jgi:CheY-like chemotaxis protein